MVLVIRLSVRVFNIPCCHGPRRLDPRFPVGDVFIADKVGNRFEDSIVVRWFAEDVDGRLTHLNEEKRGSLCFSCGAQLQVDCCFTYKP